MNENVVLKRIGERIEKEMKRQGITRYRAAKDLGVTQASIKSICEGKGGTSRLLIRACLYLSIDAIELTKQK